MSMMHPVRRSRASFAPALALALALAFGALLLGAGGCGARFAAPATPRQLAERDAQGLRLRLAETLVQQRDYDLALPYLRDLLVQVPGNARLHLLLGIVLREKGVHRVAEAELRRALELAPRESAAHAALGALLAKTGRAAEGERHHRRAVALAPQHAPHHSDLGFCLLLQKRYGEAATALEAAIRIDPSLRVAFNNLGFARAMDDDEEGARRAFLQGGSRAMALTNLGFVAELRGQPGAARHYYEQALRAKRGYPPALRNLRHLDPQAQSAEAGEGSGEMSPATPAAAEAAAEEADDGGARPAAGRTPDAAAAPLARKGAER